MLDPVTERHYRDLAGWIALRHAASAWRVFGVHGAQGSGKSTAVRLLQQQLAADHGLRVATLALDDFYLPRAARQALAANVHPLLVTRGVPGTHEVSLGVAAIDRLLRLKPGETLPLPRFSKADDDRLPADAADPVTGPIDLVLFEGWCVGTPAQTASELAAPVNALEETEDADGRWRTWVNARLATDYRAWFAWIDALIVLQVPDFDCVRRWRWQQEQETARAAGATGAGLMSEPQLERFLQHYQRLTLHALRTLPAQADVQVILRRDHGIDEMRFRSR